MLTEEERRFAGIFMPYALAKTDQVAAENSRFVHYTSAETAMKIIQSGRIWMRNAMTMNDFSEVSYGRNCLIQAYQDERVGGRLKAFLNGLFPNFTANFEAVFDSWLPHFEQDTYILSLSEHDAAEDVLGRLSMWRAYCPSNGVAIVVNNAPFSYASNELQASSSPVAYLNSVEFAVEFDKVTEGMMANEVTIRALGEQGAIGAVFQMFKSAILCTKHPGFAEEREWRVIYSPTQNLSRVIERSFATVKGIPQEIHQIPLAHDPVNGLYQADIPHLLDRIIVGPSPQPFTMMRAFVRLLGEAGVPNPEQRVFVSEIPLRTG